MAEGKKSFILYADYQGVFNQLPDEIAGKLVKHLFAYVNDENPVCSDLLISVAFEPIKNQLKRDLKEWDETKTKRSESGTLGGLKSGETRRKQAEAKRSSASKNEANEAVTVTVNVNDTVTVNDKNDLGDKSPPPKTLEQREEDFRVSLIPFVEEFSKETTRAFFDYWTEKNPQGKKMKFEMERTFEIKKRLTTWKSRESKFEQKNKSFGNDKNKQTTFDKLAIAGEEARRILKESRTEHDDSGTEGYSTYDTADN